MEYQDLLQLLVEKQLSLSCMESLTGGMFASTFTGIPGASAVFQGGIVTYSNEAKEHCHVSKDVISQFGAVSKECAKEMVENASRFFQTNCAVSFTGNAGPSESEDKPVGLVYIGIKIKNQITVYELHLSGERNDIRKQCVDFAFKTLIEEIQK